MHPQIAKSTKIGYNAYDRSGNHLCRTFAEGEHGERVATFIARACNSHDALVVALQRMVETFSHDATGSGTFAINGAKEALRQAQQ